MAYSFSFALAAEEHLARLSARDRAMVLAAIKGKLTHEPNSPARNRKPLQPNNLAEWELRVGEFRVYYDLDLVEKLVLVKAVGVKNRDQVWIGGERVDL